MYGPPKTATSSKKRVCGKKKQATLSVATLSALALREHDRAEEEIERQNIQESIDMNDKSGTSRMQQRREMVMQRYIWQHT
jgi:hypothetical protein